MTENTELENTEPVHAVDARVVEVEQRGPLWHVVVDGVSVYQGSTEAKAEAYVRLHVHRP